MIAPLAAAATRGWLARLPAAERAAAQSAMDWRLLAWAAGFLALLLTAAILARLDVAGRIRRRTRRAFPWPWLADAAAAAALALALATVGASAGALSDWRTNAILGVGAGSAEELAGRLRAAAASIPPLVLGAALIAPPLLAAMRRWPRAWPLVSAPALSALLLGTLWLPHALAIGPALAPAPAGPAQAGVQALLAQTGLATRTVFVAPVLGFDADVAGGLAPPKVEVGAPLLAAPPAQARASVAHLIGHYVHQDVLWVTLVLCMALTGGLVAIAAGAAPLARLIGGSASAGALDAAFLPAAAMILVVTLYAAGLAGGAYLRWANVRADTYSLDHAREPDGLAGALEQGWDHDAVDPSPLEEAVFYTHPPLEQRIGQAMRWKLQAKRRGAFSFS